MKRVIHHLSNIKTHASFGRVKALTGPLAQVVGLEEEALQGALCEIVPKAHPPILAEIVGFSGSTALAMPYAAGEGVGPNCIVRLKAPTLAIYPHESWLGRVVDAHGCPLDRKGPVAHGMKAYPTRASPLPAHRRGLVKDRLGLGVRAIDTFMTCCKGQRMGIFAGSGVGKSSLLSQIARFTQADVIVIGLIGERGREVREFIDEQLGPEGMKKCVVVVATSDETALTRRQAAYTTVTIADFFRDQGKQVLCLMDSVTRFAMALREIGLAAGEPPASKGYTPSVFAELPRLLERTGPGLEEEDGTITGLFTVLVEGDDHNEPISDAVRGILDGHIVLDRVIAQRGRYPAIHVPKSLSRMVPGCLSPAERAIVVKARALLSAYDEMEDLIRLGAYKRGTSADVDEAMRFYPALEAFLAQELHDQSDMHESFMNLANLLDGKSP